MWIFRHAGGFAPSPASAVNLRYDHIRWVGGAVGCGRGGAHRFGGWVLFLTNIHDTYSTNMKTAGIIVTILVWICVVFQTEAKVGAPPSRALEGEQEQNQEGAQDTKIFDDWNLCRPKDNCFFGYYTHSKSTPFGCIDHCWVPLTGYWSIRWHQWECGVCP